MKKKFLAVSMAMAMAFTMGTTAFANEAETPATSPQHYTTPEGSTSFDVTSTSTVTAANADDKVYCVEISWTMTPGASARTDTYQWNPQTLRYDAVDHAVSYADDTDATAVITVKNRSNDDIAYGISYDSKVKDAVAVSDETKAATSANANGVLATADYNTQVQAAATHTQVGEEQSATYSGVISYTEGFHADNNPTMGTYTVNISLPSGN